ncbi:MAG: response regulator transcription factor [Clostridiales bacterium]|nr:response regulator transcription factor [Clostridiales bacterium]
MDYYTVLVVDDEESIVNIIEYNLKKEKYNVLKAYNGEDGLNLALTKKPDLVILDIMMPKMDGYEVCRRLRAKSDVPIIMLTARADEVDTILGLEMGADDYVTKPFKTRELLARVKANIRRKRDYVSAEKEEALPTADTFKNLVIDYDRYEVTKNGESIYLTMREYELLFFLAKNKKKPFTREELLTKVWGYDYSCGDARSVDVTIRRLREKIEDDPGKPQYIITKRGIGYYFAG